MLRSTIILLFLLWSSIASAQKNPYRPFYLVELDKEKCTQLFNLTKEKSTPLMKAYHGASLAMLADFGFNISKKMDQFNTGKTLIAEAIAEDPNNVEIRLIRFSIQHEAPGFLGYDCCIEEDLALLKEALRDRWLDDDPDYKTKLLAFFEARDISIN
jgi:hypothetical protein